MSDGSYRYPRLSAYLRRQAGEDEALVWLHSEEIDTEIRLTLDEAREVAVHLNALLAMA